MSFYTRAKTFLRNTLAKGSDVRFEYDSVATALDALQAFLQAQITSNALSITNLGGLGTTIYPTANFVYYGIDNSAGAQAAYSTILVPSTTGATISSNSHMICYKPTLVNTGAVTLDIGSTEGAVNVKKFVAGTKVALEAGDWKAKEWQFLIYDGVDFISHTPEPSDRTTPVETKTTTYTVVAADDRKVIEADASGGAFTITLTAAATLGDGFRIAIKLTDASNQLTIDANGSETIGIDGDLTLVLGIQGQTVVLVCDGTNWQIESLYPLNEVLVANEQASGTDAGASSAASWNTLVLNTEVVDTGNNSALASDQITLAAGTYEIVRGSVPGHKVNSFITRLRNTTGTATIAEGTAESATAAASAVTRSELRPLTFTVAASQALELQGYPTTTQATDGWGLAATSGMIETFAFIHLRRIQ